MILKPMGARRASARPSFLLQSLLLRSPKQHFISNLCILTGFPIIYSTVIDTGFDPLRVPKSSTEKEADPAKHGNC